MSPYRALGIGLVAGTVAFVLVWSIWAAVLDHQRVNALWDLEIRRAQATQQAK